jgi:hypothetical protein
MIADSELGRDVCIGNILLREHLHTLHSAAYLFDGYGVVVFRVDVTLSSDTLLFVYPLCKLISLLTLTARLKPTVLKLANTLVKNTYKNAAYIAHAKISYHREEDCYNREEDRVIGKSAGEKYRKKGS